MPNTKHRSRKVSRPIELQRDEVLKLVHVAIAEIQAIAEDYDQADGDDVSGMRASMLEIATKAARGAELLASLLDEVSQ